MEVLVHWPDPHLDQGGERCEGVGQASTPEHLLRGLGAPGALSVQGV